MTEYTKNFKQNIATTVLAVSATDVMMPLISQNRPKFATTAVVQSSQNYEARTEPIPKQTQNPTKPPPKLWMKKKKGVKQALTECYAF